MHLCYFLDLTLETDCVRSLLVWWISECVGGDWRFISDIIRGAGLTCFYPLMQHNKYCTLYRKSLILTLNWLLLLLLLLKFPLDQLLYERRPSSLLIVCKINYRAVGQLDGFLACLRF